MVIENHTAAAESIGRQLGNQIETSVECEARRIPLVSGDSGEIVDFFQSDKGLIVQRLAQILRQLKAKRIIPGANPGREY